MLIFNLHYNGEKVHERCRIEEHSCTPASRLCAWARPWAWLPRSCASHGSACELSSFKTTRLGLNGSARLDAYLIDHFGWFMHIGWLHWIGPIHWLEFSLASLNHFGSTPFTHVCPPMGLVQFYWLAGSLGRMKFNISDLIGSDSESGPQNMWFNRTQKSG